MCKTVARYALSISILAVLSSYSTAFSQSNPAVSTNSGRGNIAGPISLMSNFEFWLTIVVMIFGSIFLLFEFILLKSAVKNKTDEIVKLLLVTLIIISTLVLITSGFSNDQIAPALGLFGTIAGYLLGKSETQGRKEAEDEKKI